MNKKQAIQQLVDAHARIQDEVMTTAIWIHQSQTSVWLVELLPGFGDDDSVEDPVVMSAGKDFRYDLHIIAGNEMSLREGIQRDRELARAIVAGEVLFGPEEGRQLQAFAKGFAEPELERHA